MPYKNLIETRKNPPVQSFTPYEKDYLLNPVTNELEELPIPKNIQEKIDSYIDCALDRALERFLPKNVVEDDTVADYTQSVSDLGALGEAMEVAEHYREEFGMSDKASMADIYAEIDKRAKALKGKLSEHAEKKKEVKTDE